MACSPAKRQAMEICPNLHPRKIWVNIRTQRPSTLIFVRILSQFTTFAKAMLGIMVFQSQARSQSTGDTLKSIFSIALLPVSSAMMLRLREEHENRVLHALPHSFRRFS